MDLGIQPGIERDPRNGSGLGVGRVHAGRAPECIARELVQQDRQGQRAFGAVGPGIAFARGGGQMNA